MCRKIVQVTKDNINRIRKSLDCDFVSLTLTLEHENSKEQAPKPAKGYQPLFIQGPNENITASAII